MAELTNLSTLINRVQRWQVLSTVEEQYLVRDLDEALRTLKRTIRPPWNLKKGSLKVFSGVLEYPVASDHDELAFLDDPKNPSYYSNRPRFRYTSLKEFYENPDDRNDLAEIWDEGTKYLGVRYNPIDGDQAVRLDDAEDDDYWTGSGDAGTPVEDTTFYKFGNGSIRVPITSSTGTATIKNTLLTAYSDSEYKKKYHFKWVYLDAVPTSITLRLHIDASNYLETSGITTQFNGQSLKADSWNLVAQDLNTATATGTVSTTSSFTYEECDLVGASTGTYYFDKSEILEWSLMDYWYYSTYNIATVGETVANQEYFMNSSEVYSTDSQLVGDSEWADVIMYEAMLVALTDKEVKENVMSLIYSKRSQAWDDLISKYPSLEPLMTILKYRFTNDFLIDESI
jgi:hypothetical protein